MVGHESGSDITTGGYNVILGYRAMYDATTAQRNIAIGTEAGRFQTGAFDTVYIGHNGVIV